MNNDIQNESNNIFASFFQDFKNANKETDKLLNIYKFIFFFIKFAYSVVLYTFITAFYILKFIFYMNTVAKSILGLLRIHDPITKFFENLARSYKQTLHKVKTAIAERLQKMKPRYMKVHDGINAGLYYIVLVLFPIIAIFILLTKLPPWAKAILSALVMGLGQLFNRQYVKAVLFFGALVVVVLIEVSTGSYDGEFDLFDDRIPGEEIPIEETQYLIEFYYYAHIDKIRADIEATLPDDFPGDVDDLIPNPPEVMREWYDDYTFLEYVAELNNVTFNQENFTFKNSRNGLVTFDKLDFSSEEFYEYVATEIVRIETELDEQGVLDAVMTEAATQAEARIEEKAQEKIQIEAKTRLQASAGYDAAFEAKFDELLIAATEAKYCTFGEGFICEGDDEFELKKAEYLTLKQIVDGVEKSNNDVLRTSTINELMAPYVIEVTEQKYQIYYNEEYNVNYSYNYNLRYNKLYGELILDYDSIRFIKEVFLQRLSNAQLTFDQDDYNKMLTRIYFEIYPEEHEELVEIVNNSFHERSGYFVKGVWGAVTLGTASQKNLDVHKTKLSFFDFSFGNENYEAREIPISGHLSDKLLLRGIISILTIVYVLVIYIWNIRDAYKSGKFLEEKKKPENEKVYFARLYEEMFEYIVLTPALILVTFISVMPIFFGLAVAFTNFNIENLPPSLISWVGLENFKQVFSLTSGSGIDFGGQFWKVASWTLIWAIAATFTCFFGGFIQAVIINNKRVVFRKAWRSILILPWAVPALISQMIFRVVFNDNGYVNQVLSRVGVTKLFLEWDLLRPYDQAGEGFRRLFYFGEETFQWLTNEANPWFVRIFIIVLNVWLGFPFFMALMSGVMTSIDKSLYEAASIDGATGFQQFRFITMPLVLFATSPLLVMTFSGNFNNFGVIYFITGGGPGGGTVDTAYAGSTDILISWIYKLTTDANIRWYSMASVFSILIFLIVGTLSAWNFTRTRAFKEGD